MFYFEFIQVKNVLIISTSLTSKQKHYFANLITEFPNKPFTSFLQLSSGGKECTTGKSPTSHLSLLFIDEVIVSI